VRAPFTRDGRWNHNQPSCARREPITGPRYFCSGRS
jgi:hypothetical protein